MIITKEWLKSKHACQNNIDIFLKEWPDGCEVNRKNLERAITLNLYLYWLVENILPMGKYAEYNEKSISIETEYREARAPLNVEYNAKISLILANYRAKTSLIDIDYELAFSPIITEYGKKRAPLDVEYGAKMLPIQTNRQNKLHALDIDTLVDFLGQDKTS